MKRAFPLFFLLLCDLLFGQDAKIIGRIVDQTNGEPIEYATITLHSLPDSVMVSGLVTDPMGKFEFSSLGSDALYFSARFMGYESYHSEVFRPTGVIDVGDIMLSLSGATLAEIEVSGRAITSRHKLDKQVFDAGQFQNAKGGTASDVLKNLPSASINSFGELSIRGATGFLVMINGKPIQSDPALILKQIPANSIEDIEVITAPSAKYDPDGNAGIINIITKHGLTDGLYLVANVLGGLPSIEPYGNKNKTKRYGADVSLNFKKNKWEIGTGLDFRRSDLSGRREGYVNTYLDQVLTEFPSNGERSFDEETYAGRLSLAFTPTKQQTFTLGLYGGKRTVDRTADILYKQQRSIVQPQTFLGVEEYYHLFKESNDVFGGGEILNSLDYFNENLRVRKGDFFISSLDYSFNFSDKSTLKFSGLYERTILGGPTDNANLAYPNTADVLQLQYNDNDNPLDGARLQIDYRAKIGNSSWESGYQYRYLHHPGDFVYLDRDLTNNVWLENPLFTNSIDLTRKIHSLYSQLSGKQEKWEYAAGLRLEYFDRTVTLAQPDEIYDLSKLNLFPSVNVSYNLGEGVGTRLGYSRRIERTTTFKMTPFPEREHSETLEQGDAELLPEYIDLVEAGLVKSWGDNSIFMTVYYRHVANVINRVNTIYNDTILNRIYTNAGVANAVGLEMGTTLFPAKWWRVYLGGNVYNYRIKGQLFSEIINTANTIYSINANTNFNFNSSLSLQLGINYLSETVTAQGRDSRFYNPSLTLRKTFQNKRYALALQWQNIDLGLLNSNEQRITTIRNNFYTTTNYVYEVDILQLNFTYQLNQSTKKMDLPQIEFGKKEF
jgi:outer membrane receptor protein involved in Fe transport